MFGLGTAPEADSFLKLVLTSNKSEKDKDEILIHIYSQYHQQYQTGKDKLASVQAEQQKALVPHFPYDKQLFVYCTDAEVSAVFLAMDVPVGSVYILYCQLLVCQPRMPDVEPYTSRCLTWHSYHN